MIRDKSTAPTLSRHSVAHLPYLRAQCRATPRIHTDTCIPTHELLV